MYCIPLVNNLYVMSTSPVIDLSCLLIYWYGHYNMIARRDGSSIITIGKDNERLLIAYKSG